MMEDFKEYTLLDAVTPVAISSSTNASPIVVTATAHGFATGDLVLIYGHATNTSANGIFRVTRLTADTFSLQDINTGTNITGVGIGGATGICMVAPKVPMVKGFENGEISIHTSGTASLTIKIAGSIGKTAFSSHGDAPNFGATVSPSNPYSFLGAYDVENGAFKDGATGIVTAATDLANIYKVNTAGQKYLTVIPTAWTAGAITAKLMIFKND